MTRIFYITGDILQSKRFPEVQREIVNVRSTGYGWRYPDLPNDEKNYFISENSTDPYFEVGWYKLS